MKITILDLGINNISSVKLGFSRNLKSCDEINVIQNSADLKGDYSDLLILPGLGNFSAGMKAVNDRRFESLIKEHITLDKKLVGICLGMQLLGSKSEEAPGVKGLDLISGSIKKLPPEPREKIPHVGWASLKNVRDDSTSELFGLDGDFYFIHSYYFNPENMTEIIANTPFGASHFPSIVKRRNILGIQFHPEKSGIRGRSLIDGIIEWGRNEN
jgi:glutamine amidotransferase